MQRTSGGSPRPIATVVALAAAIALLPVASGPAHAIRNPLPDGNGHPYVGVLVDDVDEPGFFQRACTGTLVAPALMVTAAHCYLGLPLDRVWVSFDPVFRPGPEPPAVHGSVVLYPGFRHGAKYFVHDMAVVHLDAPVDITPAELPSANLLDTLDLPNQEFDIAGYGRTRSDKTHGWRSIDPNIDPDVRNVGSVSFRNLLLQEQWIGYQANVAQGESGACRGDSGSATFLSGSNTMVSVTSTGDPTCVSWYRGPRLDTPAIRAFLASQGVPLP